MATEMQSFYTPSTSTHISSHAPAAVDELINKYSSTMSTSTIPNSSGVSHLTMKNPRRNVIQRFADRVRLEYYRYEVTFGLYVMTPGEKLVANSFVMVVLSLLLWALLLYFPTLLYQKLIRLVWLLTGHSSEEMGAALGILETHMLVFLLHWCFCIDDIGRSFLVIVTYTLFVIMELARGVLVFVYVGKRLAAKI